MRILKRTLILVVLCFTACQDIPDVEKPEPFIKQGLLEDILYESILVKSAKGYNPGELKLIGINPETYIYEKFDVDSVTYAKNLSYYISDLERYKTITTNVLERVTTQLKIDDSLESIEKKIKDSLRALKAAELADENKRRDSLGLEKLREKPSLIIPDSMAIKYRGFNRNR